MEPKLDRSYSARSEDALGSLSRCDANLGQYEGEFKDMVLECTKNPSKDRLLDIKNALAILLGKAEKLQDTKIDAVIVGKCFISNIKNLILIQVGWRAVKRKPGKIGRI